MNKLTRRPDIEGAKRLLNYDPKTGIFTPQNRDCSSHNTSGVIGVYQIPSGRWRARIGVNNKYIHLGYFNTIEEASRVYQRAAEIYFGEFKP